MKNKKTKKIDVSGWSMRKFNAEMKKLTDYPKKRKVKK
jgi:hypothetical protein